MPTREDYMQKWLDGMFGAIGATYKPVRIVFEGEKQLKVNPFEIQSVLSNRKKNAFTVVWADGTTTVVHCQPGDDWDDEKALAMCFTKKALGNKGNFNDKFNDALDNKRKIIPGDSGTAAKHECHCDTPCEDCSCKRAGAATKATNTTTKLSAEIENFLSESAEEPVEIKRYNLLLVEPGGIEKEICYNCTDGEIHKAMRAYRKKHYPILEANGTPYRVWQRDGALIVDFGTGSYFKVPGMDHDTFVKR